MLHFYMNLKIDKINIFPMYALIKNIVQMSLTNIVLIFLCKICAIFTFRERFQ